MKLKIIFASVQLILVSIEISHGASYDPNGQLAQVIEIDESRANYQYDAAGNIISAKTPPDDDSITYIINGNFLNGHQGTTLSYTILSNKTLPFFSASNLPQGLSLNANTGTLSGIPTTSGVFPVTVTISSGGESNDVTLVIHIRPASTAPVVLRDPQSSDVSLGHSITLSPDIDGSSPMTYQWKKNGTPIPGATTLSYSIPAITTGDAGDYSLTATNSAGSGTSEAATLSVNQPLAINGGSGGLPISFNGSPAWYSQTSTTWDGVAVLQSGAIGANGTTSFETTVTGPGLFAWRWKVSSQEDADGIVFYLDDVAQQVVSGEVDWDQTGALIESGAHTLRWSYAKNFGTNTGQDAGWVADAYFIEGWLLNADEVGAGTVEESPETEALYANGTTVTVTAIPESGYYFSAWEGDLSGSANPTTITMNAHKAVTAIFKEDLGVALGATKSQWITDGNSDWFSQLFVSINDGIAAESGAIANNQSTWVETTVTGPGTLSWWWKVSSESGYDKLTLTINGAGQSNISGEVEWVEETLTLPAGTQTLRWTYSKDGNAVSGQDTAWLDAVEFLPDDAYEENDTIATAHLFNNEGIWLSALNGQGIQADDDWFRIQANAGDILLIDCLFSDDEGGIDLELYDSIGSRIGSAYSVTDNEQIEVTVPSSGEYLIRVYFADAGNKYDLRWLAVEVTTWYANALNLADGWRYFDWFKGFKPEGENWIYHGRHGWLYTLGEDTSGLFLWDVALGRWMFTNETAYPWMYAYGPAGGWVFFFEGGRPGARYFKRGDNGTVISEQDLGVK